MRFKDLLKEADGPKQGSSIIKTQSRDTFDTLANIRQWQQEIEDAKRKLRNQVSAQAAKRRRQRNDLVVVDRYSFDVTDLEKWLNSSDNDWALEWSKSKNMGLGRWGKNIKDEVYADPDWQKTILDMWLVASKKYLDSLYVPSGPESAEYLATKLDIIGRKYRIKHNIDKTGKRVSPVMPHPESELPTMPPEPKKSRTTHTPID